MSPRRWGLLGDIRAKSHMSREKQWNYFPMAGDEFTTLQIVLSENFASVNLSDNCLTFSSPGTSSGMYPSAQSSAHGSGNRIIIPIKSCRFPPGPENGRKRGNFELPTRLMG